MTDKILCVAVFIPFNFLTDIVIYPYIGQKIKFNIMMRSCGQGSSLIRSRKEANGMFTTCSEICLINMERPPKIVSNRASSKSSNIALTWQTT